MYSQICELRKKIIEKEFNESYAVESGLIN